MPCFDLDLSGTGMQICEFELILWIILEVLEEIDENSKLRFFEKQRFKLTLANNELLKDSVLGTLNDYISFLQKFEEVELNFEWTGLTHSAMYHSLIPLIQQIPLVSLNLSCIKLNFTFISLFCEVISHLHSLIFLNLNQT